MRVLSVGESEELKNALIHLGTRRDVSLGRVKSVREVESVLQGGEAATLLCTVSSDEDLHGIAALQDYGVRTIVLTEHKSPVLRDAAFKAGACEVLFMPVDPAQVETAVLAMFGKVLQKDFPAQVELDALIEVDQSQPPVLGTVRVLSRAGMEVHTAEEVPVGIVARIALRPPAPRDAVFHVYVVRRDSSDDGFVLQLRCAGLFDADQARLEAVIETVAPNAALLSDELGALDQLDPETLRAGDRGEIAGIRVPPLTALERGGLERPDDPLALVAVARCRAAMLATHFKKCRQRKYDFRLPPDEILARWRVDLQAAGEKVRTLLREDSSAGDGARPLRDLSSKVDVSRDQLEWVVSQVTGVRQVVVNVERDADATLEPGATPAAETTGATDDAEVSIERPPIGALTIQRKRLFLLIGTLGLVLVLSVLIVNALSNRDRRPTDQEIAHNAITRVPVFEANGVRFASVQELDGEQVVAVVDGSWYEADDRTRIDAIAALAADSGGVPKGSLVVKDFAGRNVAVLLADGTLTLH